MLPPPAHELSAAKVSARLPPPDLQREAPPISFRRQRSLMVTFSAEVPK